MSLFVKNNKLLINEQGKVINCSQCPCNISVEDEDIHYGLIVKETKLGQGYYAFYTFINVYLNWDFPYAVRDQLPVTQEAVNNSTDQRTAGLKIPHYIYAPERWEYCTLSFQVIKNHTISNIKRFNSYDVGNFQFTIFGDITTGYLGSIYLSATPLNAAGTLYSYDINQYQTQEFQTHIVPHKFQDNLREEEIYNFYYLTGASDINTFINTVKQLANRPNDNVVQDNRYFLVDNGDGTYTVKHAGSADVITPKSQISESDIIPGYIRLNDKDYEIEKDGNDYYISLTIENNLGHNMVSSIVIDGQTYIVRYGYIEDESENRYEIQKDLTTGKFFAYINNEKYYLPTYLQDFTYVTIGDTQMTIRKLGDRNNGFFYITGNPQSYVNDSSWTFVHYDDLNNYFFSTIDSGNDDKLSTINQETQFYFFKGYYLLNNTLSTFNDGSGTKTVKRRDNGELYFLDVDSNNNNVTGRVFNIESVLDSESDYNTNYVLTGDNVCVPVSINSNQLYLAPYANDSVISENIASDVTTDGHRIITTNKNKQYQIFTFANNQRVIVVQPDETKERPQTLQFFNQTYDIKRHGMSYVNWHIYIGTDKNVYEPIYYDSTQQQYYILSSADAPSAYINIDLPSQITLRYYDEENDSLQDINTYLNETSTYYVNDTLTHPISAKIEKDGLWGYNYIKNYTYTGTVTTNANQKYYNFIDGNQYLITVNNTISSFVYNGDEIKLYLDGSAIKCDIFRYVIYDRNNSIDHWNGNGIEYTVVTNQITNHITNDTYSYSNGSVNLNTNMSQITGGAVESYFEAYVDDEVRKVYYNRVTQDYYWLDDDIINFVDDGDYKPIFSYNKWYMDFKYKRVPLLSSTVSNKTVWSVVMAAYPDEFNIPDIYEPNDSQGIEHKAMFRVSNLNRVGRLNVGYAYGYDYRDHYYLDTFPFYFQQSDERVVSSQLVINNYNRNIYQGYLSSAEVPETYLISKDDVDRYYTIDKNNHVIFLPITLQDNSSTTLNGVDYTINTYSYPLFTYTDELTNELSTIDVYYNDAEDNYYYIINDYHKKVTTNGTDSNGHPIFNNIEFSDTLGTAYSTPYYEDGILLDQFINQYRYEINLLWRKENWRYNVINPLFSSIINVYCFKDDILMNKSFDTLFHTKSNFEPQTYSGERIHTGIYYGVDSFEPSTEKYTNDISDERSGFKPWHARTANMKYYTVSFNKQLNKYGFNPNETGDPASIREANQALVTEMQGLHGVTCQEFYLVTLISCDEDYNYSLDYVTSAYFTGSNARNFDFGKEYDIISHAVVGSNNTATTANTYDILTAHNHSSDMTNIQYSDSSKPLDFGNIYESPGRATVHITYIINPIKTY